MEGSLRLGTIKWFNTQKEYGFIVPDEGEDDIYLPLSTVKSAGVEALETGMAVSYTLNAGGGKVFAGTLTLIKPKPAPSGRSAFGSSYVDPYSEFEREWGLKPAQI